MNHPKLTPIPTVTQTVDVFGGCSRSGRLEAGQFRHMENLSSHNFPLLAPRPGRCFYRKPASPQGLIAKDCLCYVDGSDFVLGDTVIPMNLSVRSEDCPKQLVSMGAYVLILPDKAYINTGDPEDRGFWDGEFTTDGTPELTLCDDRGQQTDTPTHVKLTHPGIGAAFEAGDGVEITGWAGLPGGVIAACGEDYLVLPSTDPVTPPENAITVARRSPRLDFITECGNRLWGCRYGMDEGGEFVNRIYASKLGDFKNWNVFQGLSTDSYAASCGTDGPFTGAVSYFGNPLFFKETGFHKVYGSYPATFGIQHTACAGVQQGCHGSLAMVGDTLFYVSRDGVCAYDGSLPVTVSEDLGPLTLLGAAGGSCGSRYYLSAQTESGWDLYVYDAHRHLWHREDDLQAHDFCTLKGRLYCVDGRNCNILCLSGGRSDERVRWSAETGEIGFSYPDGKYLAALQLRLQLEAGSKLTLSACYDGEAEFQPLAVVFGTSLRSFRIPVRPRRCDHFRLKIEGEGGGKLYAITKRLQRG